jgi:tRNA(fMet)-specific endonuclease VapC
MHLLDSNAWIAHLRQSNAGVTQRLVQQPDDQIFLCSVVLAELTYGAFRSGAQYEAHNLALIANLQSVYTSLAFDDKAAKEYARIRAHLVGLGKSIGANDLLIAAIALANDLVLVTHNTGEFSRVPGLKFEDWQTP